MNRRNFLTMGMRTLTLACHMDEDGKMQFYMWGKLLLFTVGGANLYFRNDTESLKLDDPRIPSFKIFDPTGIKFIEVSYLKYVKHIHQILNTARGSTPPPDTVTYNGLTYHPTGLPKFPDPILNKHGVETCVAQKAAIRDYLNKHYELVTGKKAVPYGALVKCIDNGQEVITAEHWPSGIPFKETGTLNTAESNSIVRFWHKRQSACQIPFRFEVVMEGSGSVPAIYPPDIFDIGHSAAAEQQPKKIPAKKKKSTMRNPLDSDADSEHVSSSEELLLSDATEEEDDDEISPEEEEGVEQPPPSRVPTPSVVNSSLASGETRIPEPSVVVGPKSSGTAPPPSNHTSSGSPTLPPESDWGDVAMMPKTRVDSVGGGGGTSLAGNKAKGKAKAASDNRPAAVPRATRSQVAKNAPPVQGTRSKTKARGNK